MADAIDPRLLMSCKSNRLARTFALVATHRQEGSSTAILFEAEPPQSAAAIAGDNRSTALPAKSPPRPIRKGGR